MVQLPHALRMPRALCPILTVLDFILRLTGPFTGLQADFSISPVTLRATVVKYYYLTFLNSPLTFLDPTPLRLLRQARALGNSIWTSLIKIPENSGGLC